MSETKRKLTEKERKKYYWLFKLLGVFIACIPPVWAVCAKFPVWTKNHGTGHSIGIGLILILFVVLVIFRRAVFNFIRDKFHMQHAPPLAIWFVLLIISYIMVYLGKVMEDMTTVFWMGLLGCAIGNVFTFIAENRFAKKEKKKNE